MLAGPQGVGKTALAGQFALGRCGLPEYQKLLEYRSRPASTQWFWCDLSARRVTSQA
jgi:hypothetical protein